MVTRLILSLKEAGASQDVVLSSGGGFRSENTAIRFANYTTGGGDYRSGDDYITLRDLSSGKTGSRQSYR